MDMGAFPPFAPFPCCTPLGEKGETGKGGKGEELDVFHREREKREALEKGLEQMAVAQHRLESKNRRLRAQVGESDLAHAQAREQVKPPEVGGGNAPRANPRGDLQQDQ